MGVRRHVPALELPLHLRRRAARAILDAPAPELEQGCCSYGAHFVDDDDVANVVAAFVRLTPDADAVPRQGHAGAASCGPASPATTASTPTVTRLVDDACIFLNRPGFAGGAGCALHIAALEAGERPLDWKPNVCWQVPLRLEHSTDENGHVTSRLREWKRRDWGEGGAEFHWWCTESPEAFVGDRPVYQESRDEIVELVGQGDLRHAGRAAGAPGLDPAPPPGAAARLPQRGGREQVGAERVERAERLTSVVVVLVARRRTRRRTSRPGRRSRRPRRLGGGRATTAITEPEIERPRTGLLQLPRLFEAAMTTLLHAGLPRLVS